MKQNKLCKKIIITTVNKPKWQLAIEESDWKSYLKQTNNEKLK